MVHLAGHGNQSQHRSATSGRLLDRGWRYDVELWVFDTFVVPGKVRELRQRVLGLADLRIGQSLLDVGCGTGTLALQAAELVGSSGRVVGLDPARRQIARARSKARRLAVPADFHAGVVEDVDYPDASFDVVTSTLMLHHLPEDLRETAVREIARVTKPGGSFVIAEFLTRPSADDPAHRSAAEELRTLLARSGFVDPVEETIPFRRSHRDWSGIVVVRGTKA
jgi:ubiquinone/menaquinone biosynthesis C-methylase UbiE